MSSHQDLASLTNLSKEDASSSKKLAASRWAPGGSEDQTVANDQITNNKMSSNNATIDKVTTDKASTLAPKGLAKSMWSTDPAEGSQVDTKKVKATAKNKTYKDNNKASTLMLKQPHAAASTPEAPAPNEAEPQPRRIIGPLSEEEETVKMENPFFDPTKHKGLGSSRWANE